MIPTNLDDLTEWINGKFHENYSKDEVEKSVSIIMHGFFKSESYEDVKSKLWFFSSVNVDENTCNTLGCDYCKTRKTCGTNVDLKQAKV